MNYQLGRKGALQDGFARRKEQSKEEIRKAAWELFSQFGVDKVSMADIARKAGVSPATIYNNFESKETLAREFVSGMVEGLVSRAQEIITPQGSYQEKINAFFQFISAMMAGGKPASDIVGSGRGWQARRAGQHGNFRRSPTHLFCAVHGCLHPRRVPAAISAQPEFGE